MIKALVFDLDGVITETAELHFEAWVKALEKKGISYTFEENKALKGLPRKDTLLAILKLKNKTLTEEEIQEVMKEKNDFYISSLSTLSEKDILPNIKSLLIKAKEKGLKLSIASSSYNAPAILKTINLFDMFDFIVYPGDIKNGKPAADIFLAAAKGVNASAQECIGFEDAIEGIKGIHAAKMHSVAITYGVKAEWENFSEVIYTTTAEINLEALLEKFNK
ncbi:beta-phosphoglucomutase [Mycoplasma phocimorsus]|uniref:beta-phosphoglucomutase n=1 Tax=Mycoplasma phocimorsus TaxID=3045839 RepID=UPI0024C08CA8|nr:beta-phosphoglucomutase [Mycoplasma phocimorsus]MDJ1646665.1 beta-phosphoglucomutase [Mycoplasma phocimorsus]MDJ1647291.1 beta-phosphoglucomutase [Mycoplasma phocimorsus]MDJ1647620.1 beta-phosphoglucomutase [Mycoplasma phocimorsus]MDJ1648049.1 beta-phosphoglucomutase [Mycoplasma phocimorsus]